jgi:hypothetical protein
MTIDEPIEPDVAPRATRSGVKKVPQARYPKRSKKAKEADISLEAHASTVSPDDVSNASLLAFHSCTSTLTHFFFQALVKRFIALGTECAGLIRLKRIYNF